MKLFHTSLVSAAILLLAACGSALTPGPSPDGRWESTDNQPIPANLTRTDQQGAVVIEVTPLDLEAPGQTLDFQVSLNTHSVDLSMDLTALATLKTDTGSSVQAASWNGPRGGHHVSGKLSLPATLDGKGLLQGASRLTLTIQNVGAPSRVFTWDIVR